MDCQTLSQTEFELQQPVNHEMRETRPMIDPLSVQFSHHLFLTFEREESHGLNGEKTSEWTNSKIMLQT